MNRMFRNRLSFTMMLSGVALMALQASANGDAVNQAELAAEIDLPVVHIPENDDRGMNLLSRPEAPVLKTETPAEVEELLSGIRAEIGSRYSDVDIGHEESEERLNALLSGDYMSDYLKPGPGPVQFSNGKFKAEDGYGEAPAQSGDSLSELANFAITPEGIRAMASMTPDQITAIAAMAELARNPNARIDQLLSAAGEEHRDTIIDVGDGRNLALSNWYAGMDEDGSVYIVNDQLPGSRVDLALGQIVGQFGRVVDIRAEGHDVAVAFETGDVVRSPMAVDLGPAIPALGFIDDELMEEADAYAGYEPGPSGMGAISLSDPAPGQAIAVTEEASGKRAGSTRPLPRPERLTAAGAVGSNETAEQDKG